LQDIELTTNSQRVSERPYNLSVIGAGGRCPVWVADLGSMSGLPPKADSSRTSWHVREVPQPAV